MKSSPRFGLAFTLGVLTALSGMSSPARADLPIAQTPLYLARAVDPAFIMALDDSGSMRFQTLFPARDGGALWARDSSSAAGNFYSFFHSTGTYANQLRGSDPDLAGREFVHVAPYPAPRQAAPNNDNAAIPPIDDFGFSRSHVYNRAYFNPAVTYRPWRYADGSYWPNATPNATRIDPNSASPTLDITSERAFVSNAQATHHGFRVRTNMVLPQGMKLFGTNNCIGATTGNTTASTPTGWRTLNSDVTSTCDSDASIAFFPATFYLPASAAAPAGFVVANRVLATNACSYRGATGAAQCNMYRYEIKPANYTSTADYNRDIQNFANWFSFYGARNRSIISAITNSLVEIEDMRVGFFTINNRTNVDMKDLSVMADKTDFYNSIVLLSAGGNTPNLTAVNHLGVQFNRTGANAPIQEACQVNGGMLFTDGFSNVAHTTSNAAGDGAMGAPFQDGHSNTLADAATRYYNSTLRPDLPTDQVTVPSACNGANPDKRIDCRNDLHMNFYGITLGARGTMIGNTYPSNGQLATEQVHTDFVNSGTTPPWPPYESGDRSTVDDIWHATINTRGRYINASTPADITEAMTEVLTAVVDQAQPSGGTAASGTRRESGFLVYVPVYDPGDWTGDVVAYELAPGGALGNEVWSAAAKLPAPGSRNIFVSVPVAGNMQLRPFVKSSLGADDVAAATALGFGTGPNQTPLPATATIDEAISYLRGDNSRMRPGPGTVFRERTTRIGDILNSQPAVLDRGSRGYVSLSAADGGGVSGSGTYGEFVTTTKQTRTPVVFVGTNGGMLHAFEGGTDPTQGGVELFSIIPNSVLNNMNQLVQPNYQHRYYVDASPEIGDARLGGDWKSVMLTGNGGGGRSIMALDVTDPAAGFSTSDFLWEFTDRDLGLTYGRPQVVLLQDGNWYAAFGNGYNSVGNPLEAAATRGHDAYLFLVQLDNPANFVKIRASTGTDVDQVNFTTQNGLGSVTAIDTDFDLKSDVIYAPDYKGNVWKFDLSSASPAGWAVAYGGAPLYTARSGAGSLQNITGAIDVTLHHLSGYMVYFGTGKYFLKDDGVVPATAPVETFYAIWDNETTVVANRSQLVQQTILAQSTVVGVGDVRTTSENPIDWTTKRGWYLELKVGAATDGRGERFIGQPVVSFGRVVFTSFVPLGSSCEPGGRNWLFALSAIGGAPDVSLPGCSACGAISLTPTGGSQAPALSPPLITDPTQPPAAPCDPMDPNCVPPPCDPLDPNCEPDCVPGVDAGCNLPADPGASIPGRVCVVNLSVVMPTGSIPFSQVSCGRQSWRQLQ